MHSTIDWVTLLIVVCVVCVATFVCTILGMYCADRFAHRFGVRCRHCQIDLQHFAELQHHNHLEMGELRRHNPTANYDQIRNIQNRRQVLFSPRYEVEEEATKSQRVESGTFRRLGIRGSTSALLPLACQLENRQLSAIEETPPPQVPFDQQQAQMVSQLRRELEGDAARRISSSSSCSKDDNHSLERRRDSGGQISSLVIRGNFLTPSPATNSSSMRRPSPEEEEDEVFQEQRRNSGLSTKAKVLSDSFVTSDRALERMFQSEPLQQQQVRSQSLMSMISERSHLAANPSSNDENYVPLLALGTDKHLSSRPVGSPGNTAPMPLGARPKLARNLLPDIDLVSRDEPAAEPAYQDMPVDCGSLHNCQSQEPSDRRPPERRQSVRQVKKAQLERKMRNADRQLVTQGIIADDRNEKNVYVNFPLNTHHAITGSSSKDEDSIIRDAASVVAGKKVHQFEGIAAMSSTSQGNSSAGGDARQPSISKKSLSWDYDYNLRGESHLSELLEDDSLYFDDNSDGEEGS